MQEIQPDINLILRAAAKGCEILGLTPNDWRGLSKTGQDRVIFAGLKEIRAEAEAQNESE